MTARKPVPEWADEWLAGKCGCGSRLVKVYDYTGSSHTVCATSGWDIDKCPGVTGGSTPSADSDSDDPAQAGEPKPYLCGCPSDDPRPCPLHDSDSADNAQAGEQP